jgi:hypothetical protein
MNRPAALAAFKKYLRKSSRSERTEPEVVQASDLISDLLLLFTPDDADEILRRVNGNLAEEQDEVAPVFDPAL